MDWMLLVKFYLVMGLYMTLITLYSVTNMSRVGLLFLGITAPFFYPFYLAWAAIAIRQDYNRASNGKSD